MTGARDSGFSRMEENPRDRSENRIHHLPLPREPIDWCRSLESNCTNNGP